MTTTCGRGRAEFGVSPYPETAKVAASQRAGSAVFTPPLITEVGDAGKQNKAQFLFSN